MGSIDEVEGLKPYGKGEKTDEIKKMFDDIAPVYDDMNRKMTFGTDAVWRRKAVKAIDALKSRKSMDILDLATGTGDFAIAVARRYDHAHVTGLDMSEGMLRVARQKIDALGLSERIRLVKGDCMELPFDDQSFDAVTISFGLRNFASLRRGLTDAHRVLRAGGRLIVLEMVGTYKALRPFYWIYTRFMIPFFRRCSGGEKKAYEYLPASIDAFPGKKEMKSLLESCGFGQIKIRRMTFGVCEMITTEKQ